MANGTAELDFGAFPGTSHASVEVTGQTTLAADSEVEAWLMPLASADHSAEEHLVESLAVSVIGDAANDKLVIHGMNTSKNDPTPRGRDPMIWGRWSVGWVWA